ncbi:uncharacterized protein LOC130666716 [Microplitis mediator]|uniref:uncharacterized protein LOC130666716 n=1 Tax=Microplitis mediator TaxID=375433 RepID=UPI00255566AB|nr:uncharacterized protein LOC130666716 [Microplitis mediator]
MADHALLNVIVDNVFRRMPIARAINMRPEAARRHIHRQRRLHQPPLPRTFLELGDMLNDYEAVNDIYRGTQVAVDGSVAYIFASNIMINRLNNVNELFIDGTFRTVPRTPRAAQLLIIYLKKMDVGIPILFALCSSRTAAMYNAIWQFLIERARGILTNLRFIITDFEAVIISSIRTTFPFVRIRGCWFHCIRAMTRKWNSLRLPRDDNDQTLKEAWALALIPPEKFQEAIGIIAETAELIEPEHENVIMFIYYLCRQWLPLAYIVSVWNSPWRTNNFAEAFNRHLMAQINGEYPSLFVFLCKNLTKIIDF